MITPAITPAIVEDFEVRHDLPGTLARARAMAESRRDCSRSVWIGTLARARDGGRWLSLRRKTRRAAPSPARAMADPVNVIQTRAYQAAPSPARAMADSH